MHYIDKIYHESDLPLSMLENWRTSGLKIVFTNGCFDLIHRGHIRYLDEASKLGEKLVVGLNSDRSVKRLKGNDRPVKDQLNRSEILASLQQVDLVIIFEEDTPLNLIRSVEPAILVKGGDWSIDQIVGADVVLEKGGQVKMLTFVDGESSSSIIERIKNK